MCVCAVSTGVVTHRKQTETLKRVSKHYR